MNSFPRRLQGFTLVELMVSTAIIGLIMLVLVGLTNQTTKTWQSTTEKIEKFQQARDGFESMTRKLSQATLNTNWEYLDSAGAPRDKNIGSTAFKNFIPLYYGRSSDLRIVSGPMSKNAKFSGLSNDKVRPGDGIFFQAPLGYVKDTTNYAAMENLLNTWGYFVEAGLDPARPAFVDTAGVPTRWRSRLMEYMQPAENMSCYNKSDYSYNWFLAMLKAPDRPVRALAENVVTLIIVPKLSKADEDARAKTQPSDAVYLSPWYVYDSFPLGADGKPMSIPLNPGAKAGSDSGAINPKNQLPPIISVTMIAVDERSAVILNDLKKNDPLMGIDVNTQNPPLFSDLTANPLEGATGDLAKYEAMLVQKKVTYRIFTSNVIIRGAKWSRVQTK